MHRLFREENIARRRRWILLFGEIALRNCLVGNEVGASKHWSRHECRRVTSISSRSQCNLEHEKKDEWKCESDCKECRRFARRQFFFSCHLEDCVDERRQSGALRKHEQPADEHEHNENRKKPEFLPLTHECPELADQSAHFAAPKTVFPSGAGLFPDPAASAG